MKIFVRKSICAILGILIAACMVSSCSSKIQTASTGIPQSSDSPAVSSGYSEVYDAINTALQNRSYDIDYGAIEEAAIADAPAADAEAQQSGGGSDDYSKTNTQVEGVDEGDIIKTDGEYIYILKYSELLIVKADGADTKVLSKTPLNKTETEARELYLDGDRLAVISTGWHTDYNADYLNKNLTTIDVYDISNKLNPKPMHSLGQDGYFLNSRLLDGRVYLLSVHGISGSIRKYEPKSYVPMLYSDGKEELIPAENLLICPDVAQPSYTIVCAYDLENGAITSNQTLLDGGETVYMNKNNLYIAGEYYEASEESSTEAGNSMVAHSGKNVTRINKFSIDNGQISISASGQVDGNLVNQFAMDEYKGYLRVVTTVDYNRYIAYTDEENGWNSYQWPIENYTANSLYVMDEALNITGSVGGLAKDELVYSVRFDGDIGYFVTFRTVDPLFAADLSDPANPKILSALKIPGFSEYLHVYNEGRLFGLGVNADEATGRRGGMKLTMFDTSNPKDVTEKHTLLLESYYSEALYNHKAILIAPDRDIIAFPEESGYAVYGYSDSRGFYKKASIASVDSWGYEMRGLYIDDYAYIYTDSAISIMDMQSFKGVARLVL